MTLKEPYNAFGLVALVLAWVVLGAVSPTQSEEVILSASKTTKPERYHVARKTFAGPVVFRIPGSIPVSRGLAGAVKAKFQYQKPDDQWVTCWYQGRADSSRSSGEVPTSEGRLFLNSECSDGTRANEDRSMVSLRLHLLDVDGDKKAAEVTLKLKERETGGLPVVVRTVVVIPEVRSFTLVDIRTDEELLILEDGAVVELADFPNADLAIRADTYPERVGTLCLGLNGVKQIMDNPPYTIPAQTQSNEKALIPGVAKQKLSARPCSPDRNGLRRVITKSISFTVAGLPQEAPTTPIPLPTPHSPEAALLAGIDRDQNGIRDDVQEAIDNSEKIDSRELKTAVYRLAAAYQRVLLAYPEKHAVQEAMNLVLNAMFCVNHHAGGIAKGYGILKWIERKTMNTNRRVLAYRKANHYMGGSVTMLPSVSSIESACEER